MVEVGEPMGGGRRETGGERVEGEWRAGRLSGGSWDARVLELEG